MWTDFTIAAVDFVSESLEFLQQGSYGLFGQNRKRRWIQI